MDDSAFKEEFKPVQVPSSFERADNLHEKVLFVLASLDEASADEVIRKLEELQPSEPDKPLIAGVHHILAELYEKGLIAGREVEGGLVYNLHKNTSAHTGKVDPEKL